MLTYEDLINQLFSELRTSLGTKATEEQIREAAATLMGLGDGIDAAMLKTVGIVLWKNSQALAKADPNLLNTLIQKANSLRPDPRQIWRRT